MSIDVLTSERFKKNSPRIWKKNEIIKLYKKLRGCSGRVDYWTWNRKNRALSGKWVSNLHSSIWGSSVRAVLTSLSNHDVALFWMRMIQEMFPLGRRIKISAQPWQTHRQFCGLIATNCPLSRWSDSVPPWNSFFVGRLDMRIFYRNIRCGDLLFDIPLCFCAFPWWHIYCSLFQSQAITILADTST